MQITSQQIATNQNNASSSGKDKYYELQPIIVTAPILEPELYFRSTGTKRQADRGDAGVFLPPGCALDFDTYINAFHDWYWIKWTSIGATALELTIEGSATVHVYRTAQFARRAAIAHRVDCTGICIIDLPASAAGSGRLSFEIAAGDGGASLKTARWVTDRPAANLVSIDVVICTFNRQEFLAPALERLARHGLNISGLRHVVVVDQGTEPFAVQPHLHPAVAEALASERLKIFKQRNLGGSGGFTRGIIECLRETSSDTACSHIILMDDDVQFDPRLLAPLARFLERCRSDVVVGGSMLDMFRPEHLFAYSETFDVTTAHVRREQPHDMDMRDPESLGRLEGARPGNYNGWFACCFPRSVFAVHGLPLPFFIRSDDCEFGTRLTRSGVPLAHMPGLFVWHEPFWNKPRAWIDYYSYRNHLIVAVLALQKAPRRLALKQLSEFWYFITTYQYESALAVCMAMEDYCRGPDWLFLQDDAQHAAVLKAFASARQEPRRSENLVRGAECPARFGKRQARLHPWIPIWIVFLLNIHWNLFGRAVESERYGPALQAVPMNEMWFYPFHGFSTVICDTPDEDTITILRHDARIALRLTKRMIKATASLIGRWASLAKTYREVAPRYSRLESWATRLGIS